MLLGEARRDRVAAKPALAALLTERGLVRAHALVRGAGIRTAEHERARPLRSETKEARHRAAAHRLRDHVGGVDGQVLEEAGEAAAEGTAVVLTRGQRAPPAAGVVDGAAVALAESRKLLPPGEVVAAGAVQEDDVGPFGIAVLLVVEARAIEVGIRHRGSVGAGAEGHQRASARPLR